MPCSRFSYKGKRPQRHAKQPADTGASAQQIAASHTSSALLGPHGRPGKLITRPQGHAERPAHTGDLAEHKDRRRLTSPVLLGPCGRAWGRRACPRATPNGQQTLMDHPAAHRRCKELWGRQRRLPTQRLHRSGDTFLTHGGQRGSVHAAGLENANAPRATPTGQHTQTHAPSRPTAGATTSRSSAAASLLTAPPSAGAPMGPSADLALSPLSGAEQASSIAPSASESTAGASSCTATCARRRVLRVQAG